MQFTSVSEFDKDFDNLLKKWCSLKDDLERLKSVLEQIPRGHRAGIVRISGSGVKTEIYKVKHFRCKDMKGKGSHSGIRVVYAYSPEQNKIEFVEIYYKKKMTVIAIKIE